MYHVQLLRGLAEAAPGLHLHAFSPQELLFIAEQDQVSLQAVLEALCGAGLGSVPGTAAEVLSEPLRQRLCPEKLTARQWCAVILQVHEAGLASTATLMAGHLESVADRAAHLLTLVALQQRAWQHRRSGFSEFVLLPFIGAAAPAPLRQRQACLWRRLRPPSPATPSPSNPRRQIQDRGSRRQRPPRARGQRGDRARDDR
jgi:FO synthase subunit 2